MGIVRTSAEILATLPDEQRVEADSSGRSARATGVRSRDGRGRTRTDVVQFGQKLSDQERLVLKRVALGMTTVEIAKAMYLSHHTVKTHIKRASVRLGAVTRSHAVYLAMKKGFIS